MMAGALLAILGQARLGAVIRFIPYRVTVGFASGIALIIAAGQLPDALGPQDLPQGNNVNTFVLTDASHAA